MPIGEFPHSAPGEMGPSLRLEIRNRCLNEVQRGLADVHAMVMNGKLEGSTYNDMALEALVSGRVTEAVNAGDLSRAEAELDFLTCLPEVDGGIVAGACFTLGDAGSRYAFDILRKQLQDEKADSISEAVSQSEPHPYIFSGLLEGVILACEQRSIPPNAWIDAYAINAEHRWKLYVAHYGRKALSEEPEAEGASQAALERITSELLSSGTFADSFIYDQTEHLLPVVKSPELRSSLLERYQEIANNMSFTQETLKQYVDVGSRVLLAGSALATPENIASFEATINKATEALQGVAGMDSFDVTYDQLYWQLLLKKHHGAAPQEFIDYLDLQTSHLLAADIPETSDDLARVVRNRQTVAMRRDGVLSMQAGQSAEAGDFAAARVYIANIGGNPKNAFTVCLRYATTEEQIDALKPDEMTLAFNPEIATQFRIAEALVNGDPEVLSALALEIAMASNNSRHIPYDDIARMYEAVAQKQDPLGLARDLLTILRAKGARLSKTVRYSGALIRAGDPDEPRLAYEAILSHSERPAGRLYTLWRLAQLLAE